ncbi:hypothetical protein [Pseudomonas sp. H3(2019)]|uniref:hypothetical protein n=1 Tax=Pseudomonas sp. H3(2019) TaxID=2598724 RepID=UPI0015B52DAC|nr:hypothetical protein [Pseudomonas sp. H3(2019)]
MKAGYLNAFSFTGVTKIMAYAQSTLTAANISTHDPWTPLVNSIINTGKIYGEDVEVIGAVGGTGLVTTTRAGMLVLDGLKIGQNRAHISIVPNDSGMWTYFHVTLVGGTNNGSIYYQLEVDEDKELDVKTSSKSLMKEEGKKAKISTATHTINSQPENLLGEITILMQKLIGKSFSEGEAT